ncbi:MAG TPA: hypothetical protein VFA86_06505 [Gammaproteobacteria bacterium]|nr:hypothetical protein [Gammaproteobacteria bacterium]
MRPLTERQRALLQELEESWGHYPLDKDERNTAFSLQRRGMINVERDEYGDLFAYWDDEAHADWIREQEGVE